MRTQLGYVERVTGIYTLVNWWDAWFADFSDTVGANGQKWARDAIRIATQAIYDANRAAVDAGRPTAATTAVLTAQLGAFADSIKKMVAPTLPQIPLLPPPGGFKRSVIDGESWSGEDVEEMLRLELDEEVWEKSMGGIKVPSVLPREDVAPNAHGHGHAHAHGRHHRVVVPRSRPA
jgi:hypothetical protein